MSKFRFVELRGNRFRIIGSNNRIVSKEEKLKLEKQEIIIEDLTSNDCQKKNIAKIKKNDEELKNIANENKPVTSNSIKKTK